MDFKKKLLYKMLVKYYLSDSIKASFEDFTLGLQNSWAFKTLGPALNTLIDLLLYKTIPSGPWQINCF